MNESDRDRFVFETLHREIQHEVGLVANRMTWLITSQSFLLSAFVITGGAGHTYQSWARWFVPLIGILISMLGWFAILAGLIGVRRLMVEESTRFHSGLLGTLPLRRLPNLVDLIGLMIPAVVPLIFVLVWIIGWLLANR